MVTTRWIDLTKLREHELTNFYRELLRRGWVWLIVDAENIGARP